MPGAARPQAVTSIAVPAMARALATRPKLILADEPTGNLDNKTGEKAKELLFSEIKLSNASAIIVTHNETLAKTAERVIHMIDGLFVEA